MVLRGLIITRVGRLVCTGEIPAATSITGVGITRRIRLGIRQDWFLLFCLVKCVAERPLQCTLLFALFVLASLHNCPWRGRALISVVVRLLIAGKVDRDGIRRNGWLLAL
jgi:hypothetical protein